MVRPAPTSPPSLLALVAALVLAAFLPLTTGLAALGDEDCDCAGRHQDGDDEDHCPPFCGSCLDCAGCFHLHAVVTPALARVPAVVPTLVPLAPIGLAARPPDSPSDEPVHVPRRAG